MKTRTFKLNKLVRDKIVQSTIAQGGKVDYKLLSGKKLEDELIKKLIEEAKELEESEVSIGELADIQEILDSLAKNHKISAKDIAKSQQKKRLDNGGFKKGHYINQLTLPSENKWADYYADNPKRFPEVNSK